jgi:hypothetical protein
VLQLILATFTRLSTHCIGQLFLLANQSAHPRKRQAQLLCHGCHADA